jgi:hypothetical protein
LNSSSSAIERTAQAYIGGHKRVSVENAFTRRAWAPTVALCEHGCDHVDVSDEPSTEYIFIGMSWVTDIGCGVCIPTEFMTSAGREGT